MRRNRHLAALAFSVFVLSMSLAACGGGDREAAGAPSATVTVTETITETPTPEASESPTQQDSATPQAPNIGDRSLEIGQWREGTQVRTRVTDFVQAADAKKPSYLNGETDGDGAIARVEMCTRDGAETLKDTLYGLFVAYDTSGGQYTQSSSSWEDWPPLPQLPSDVSITPGKCLSGWVLVTVPRATTVVTFDLSDGEGGSIAEWNVG